jgi:isoquinoline 1-oxidoreductase beta subunit
MIAHAHLFGAKVKSLDDTDALKVKGVVKVFKISSGVDVVDENT